MIIICKNCSKEVFSVRKGRKFCNSYCKYHFYSDSRDETYWLLCDHCGEKYHPFKVFKYQETPTHFCSRKCNLRYQVFRSNKVTHEDRQLYGRMGAAAVLKKYGLKHFEEMRNLRWKGGEK